MDIVGFLGLLKDEVMAMVGHNDVLKYKIIWKRQTDWWKKCKKNVSLQLQKHEKGYVRSIRTHSVLQVTVHLL
ncbi:MAG: hypothetical protein HUK00_01725 [Bacteroidaceae bacterium]|nr:hypothetical protein [Bacteroidaceae bacterium]